MTVHLVETSDEDSLTAVTAFVAGLLNEGEVRAHRLFRKRLTHLYAN